MKKNKISLIVGVGNIGFRHFQALLNCSFKQKIYIFDISNAALDKCKKYKLGTSDSNEVKYIGNFDEISDKIIDFLILSTSADVRYELINLLCDKFYFKNIILEKYVFQSSNQFLNAHKIFKKLDKTNVYVNLPRRVNKFYKKIKRMTSKDKLIKAEVFGEDWGLACNSIHFIDIISFITDSKIRTFNLNKHDLKLSKSKRNGYVEFIGSINLEFQNKAKMTLTSSPINKIIDKNIFIYLYFENINVFIVEGSYSKPYAIIQSKVNPESVKKSFFSIDFISQSTTKIIDSLFKKNVSNLPEYKDIYKDHIKFNENLLEIYNQLEKKSAVILPIT